MEISFGSNDLPASASFNQRLAYKNNYPAGINEYRTLDFWYDDMLYGRVDTQGDTIYPSEARLKQLKTDGNESLFALDFVVDAYNGFIGAMQQQENNGNFILLDGSVFASRFTAVRGWYNINEIFYLSLFACSKGEGVCSMRSILRTVRCIASAIIGSEGMRSKRLRAGSPSDNLGPMAGARDAT